ncbi:MAG: 30S ribosomal protein S9 [DPANN group archaeon]|nr:30S ribosomal protein S9 [DPANN group archaeon]
MKVINTVGKRKNAVARAVLKKGTGQFRINRIPFDLVKPELSRLRLIEPIRLSKAVSDMLDIDVVTNGGGTTGMIDAARQAVARGIVSWTGDDELKSKFVAYDRNLIVNDPRRNEVSKQSHSSMGPRRKRQSSKR